MQYSNSILSVYGSLVDVSEQIAKAIKVSNDFPVYFSEGSNEQLRQDLSDAQKIIDGARYYLTIGSALGETNEKINGWDLNRFDNNGGLYDGDVSELNDYFYNGVYKDRLTWRINKQIKPNQITYYLINGDDKIINFDTDYNNLCAEYRYLLNHANGDEKPETYKIRSARINIYYNDVLVDFDNVIKCGIDSKIYEEPDAIYGDVDEFLLEVRKAVDDFEERDITEQFDGITYGDIKIQMK